MCIQSWELFLILPPLCRNQSAISITLSCLFHLRRTIFTIQKGGVYTFEKALYRYPTIQVGCADGGYRGTFRNTFDEFHNIRIDIQKGFQVLPKRWVVERTFAWLNGSRGRLSKDYETSCCSAKTMIMISHAATLLKRL